jgi:chromosome partitioning protein
MQRITVINAKGGCGKTTIATNLASAYAGMGRNTTLIDYDPQGSSMFWLNMRPDNARKINGIAAYPSNKPVTRSWQLRMPPETERVIVDTPAGLKGLNLIDQLRGTHTILVPVLPSTIDTHATADFIRDLYLIAKVRPNTTRLCIICNRVKSNTLSFRALQRFLDAMKIPVIAELRDTQNYNKASDNGLGIQELTTRASDKDQEDWKQIVDWLDTEPLTRPLTVVKNS